MISNNTIKMAFDLKPYRTDDKNEITHLLMSSPGGKFNIPLDKEFELFKYIKRNPKVCITQRPTNAFPLFFDIDKLEGDIKDVIKKIKDILINLYPEDDLDNFYVLKNSSKPNYHIHFPQIIVTKSTALLIVNTINKENKNLLDKSVYTNGLRLYPTLKPKSARSKHIQQKNSDYKFISDIGKGTPRGEERFVVTTIRSQKDETEMDNDVYQQMLEELSEPVEQQEEEQEESKENQDKAFQEVRDLLSKKFGNRTYNIDKIVSDDDKVSYKISAENFCFVTKGHHNDRNQSCLYIGKYAITASCLTPDHDKKKYSSSDPDFKKMKMLLGLIKGGGREQTDFQKLVEKVTSYGKKHNYKRNGGYIMKPNPKIPIIYDKLMEYGDYINMIFGDVTDEEYFQLFRKSPYNYSKLLMYLEKIGDPNLEFVRTNQYIFAFNNGYLDITDLYNFNFTKWKNMRKDEKILTNIHYDVEFNDKWLQQDEARKLKTPIFDTICNHHFAENKGVYGFFLGMMGRLHYPVHKYDKFNCIPFIKGGSNTGKSTTGNIITYNHQNIGTISGKMEDTFGLQTLYKKRLVYVQECPKNLHKKLAKTDIQRMIEGSRIDIPRKGLDSINHIWDTPMLFLGNDFPQYQDKSGAIPRRLCIFFMDTFVPPNKRDTTLEERCKKEEAHKILFRTLYAYQDLIRKFKDKTFEDWNIPYFKEGYEELMVDCNHLYKFLNLAPNDWDSWPVRKVGERIELKGTNKFKEIFERYLYFQTRNRNNKWTKDKTTLERMGYKLVTEKVCAFCGKTFNEDKAKTCCEDFSVDNLRDKDYILNMKIINKDDIADCGIEVDSDDESS